MAEKDSDQKSGKVKLSFLSNFTIEPLATFMMQACEEEKIICEIHVGSYGQYAQEIINPSSHLYESFPNIVFLLLDGEKLFGEAYSAPYSVGESIRKKIFNERLNEVKRLLDILKNRISAKIIINEILLPKYSSFGVLENKQRNGIQKLVNKFNNELKNVSSMNNQIFVFDFNSFCMRVGYHKVVDKKVDYLADMKISIPALKELAKDYLAYILPATSKTKKCVVLDLDNTLWGGVVGESGIEGIKLGPEKDGKPFLDLQRKLKELFNMGIILAINSKNNLEDAMNVIRNHKYMILREDNFAAIRINWQDKVTNMREIAEELNIGLDSMVFLDDDATNRALIREFLPVVKVIDLPADYAEYTECLEELKLFSKLASTKEDFERGKMYVDQRKREQLKLDAGDLDSFLAKLKIQWEIEDARLADIPRVAQLTQKTNQFNLTTKRYHEEEIKQFIECEEYRVKFLKVKDRFGDYGVTGVVIIRELKEEKIWEIDSFLLSCRILGKKIEYSLIDEICKDAKNEGVNQVNANFIPTSKNLPAQDFLERAGFTLNREENSIKHYLKVL